jgi:hypothetical protein
MIHDSRISIGAELDDMIAVVTPRRWLPVLVLVLVAIAGSVWATQATLPSTVAMSGILVHGYGPQAAVAAAPGTLVEFAVRPGRLVDSGDAVATVRDYAGQYLQSHSPIWGRVVSLLAAPGQHVDAASPLVAIDAIDQPLRAVFFVPYREGVPVHAGLPVRIRLTSQHSAISSNGVVATVSRYPSTPSDLRNRFAGLPIETLTPESGPWRLVDVEVRSIGFTGSGQLALESLRSDAIPSLISVFADVTVAEPHPIDILLRRG